MNTNNQVENYLGENQLLVGILVDVSYSMRTAINNPNFDSTTRLQGFRDAFKNIITESKRILDEKSQSAIKNCLKCLLSALGLIIHSHIFLEIEDQMFATFLFQKNTQTQ